MCVRWRKGTSTQQKPKSSASRRHRENAGGTGRINSLGGSARKVMNGCIMVVTGNSGRKGGGRFAPFGDPRGCLVLLPPRAQDLALAATIYHDTVLPFF